MFSKAVIRVGKTAAEAPVKVETAYPKFRTTVMRLSDRGGKDVHCRNPPGRHDNQAGFQRVAGMAGLQARTEGLPSSGKALRARRAGDRRPNPWLLTRLNRRGRVGPAVLARILILLGERGAELQEILQRVVPEGSAETQQDPREKHTAPRVAQQISIEADPGDSDAEDGEDPAKTRARC